METNKFSTKDCIFTILCQTPTGELYQSAIKSDDIKMIIDTIGEFKVYEDKVEGITLKLPIDK